MSEPAARESGQAISGPLSARSARTLYNVADALFPPGPQGAPGGGDVDVAPFVERRLRWAGVQAARRRWLLLTWVEWLPLLTLHSRRGFSRLPREDRARLLGRFARSRLVARRRALEGLRSEIEEALAEARAAGGANQSPVS